MEPDEVLHVSCGAGQRAGGHAPDAEAQRPGGLAYRADRGGEATYHGPGQLVAYPVVKLRRGVVAHVEALARAVVETAARFGVVASFDRAAPGVWVEGRKLASIGVHVHRRVATHGVAFNVTPEALAGFRHIVPCGMPDVRMTCLELERGAPVDRAEVRRTFTDALLRAFEA